MGQQAPKVAWITQIRWAVEILLLNSSIWLWTPETWQIWVTILVPWVLAWQELQPVSVVLALAILYRKIALTLRVSPPKSNYKIWRTPTRLSSANISTRRAIVQKATAAISHMDTPKKGIEPM